MIPKRDLAWMLVETRATRMNLIMAEEKQRSVGLWWGGRMLYVHSLPGLKDIDWQQVL